MQAATTETQWYSIDDIDQLDTPALVIYPERVKENIRRAIHIIGNPDRLRPHVKTHKTQEITRLMIAAGVNKFKCATIAEAEMLGMSGAKDVLLAYQPFGPKLDRLLALIEKYPETKFSCLIDNLETAKSISELALSLQLQITVYIDLNVGMNRTGIIPGEYCIELFENTARLKGIRLLGFHAYDGHVHDKDIRKRKIICEGIYSKVESLKLELEKRGFQHIKIIIGGSPGFPVYAEKPDVECSPGTFVFWDKNYQDELPEQDFLPAALVLSRVVSLPDPTRICLDLGHKSVASENSLEQRFFFLNTDAIKIEGHSEEHLVLDAGQNHQWKIGDLFYILPFHVCPTCALYEYATPIQNRKTAGSWKIIARDRKISI